MVAATSGAGHRIVLDCGGERRGRFLGLLIGWAVAVLGGCDCTESSGPSAATDGASPTALSAVAPAPLGGLGVDGGGGGTLSIRLRPRLQPQPGVSVVVELSGPQAAALTAFRIAPRWASAVGPRNVRDLVVVDTRGSLPFEEQQGQAGQYALGRGPVGGRIRASYFAAAPEEPSRLDLSVTATAASGVGHSFLVLPALDEPLDVRLTWDLTQYGAGSAAASYGVGTDVVTRATPAELAHSVYVAGPLVVRDGGFGERLVVLGRPAFAPAAALRFCSDALHRARQLFEPTDREPFSFVFVPQPHVGGDHDGASLFQSFALWFDEGRRFDDRLAILAAHELVHRWIGQEVRLVEPNGSDATWFSEGFATHYARTLLYRHDMISAEAFAADLNRSYDVQRRARRAPGSPDTAAPPAPAGAAGARLPVDKSLRSSVAAHRGALYAARIDAELKRKRRGRLDPLVVALLERARDVPGRALPVAAWRELLEQRLGPSAASEFDRLMIQGEGTVDVPFDGLGACLVRTVVKDGAYELGFDPASLGGERPVIRGLVPGSAAEAAGVREGDVVVSGQETVRLGDPNHTITLVVSGARGARVARFNPQSTKPRVRWQVAHSCR